MFDCRVPVLEYNGYLHEYKFYVTKKKKKKKREQPFRTCVGFFLNFAFNIDVDVNNFF